MFDEMLETLLVNLQKEKEEGLNIREDIKSGPSTARQCRKQYRETAELVMELLSGEGDARQGSKI